MSDTAQFEGLTVDELMALVIELQREKAHLISAMQDCWVESKKRGG